jgi:hypothetical protein
MWAAVQHRKDRVDCGGGGARNAIVLGSFLRLFKQESGEKLRNAVSHSVLLQNIEADQQDFRRTGSSCDRVTGLRG